MSEQLKYLLDESAIPRDWYNLCGHGHFDMQAYTDYFAGKLTNQTYAESELAMALAGLPAVANG